MRTLLNAEHEFTEGEVTLSVILNYDNLTYTITEPHQEGVFYGNTTGIEEGKIKVRLLTEAMQFISDELSVKEPV